MANQGNYVERIPTNPKAFSVSRIAESEGDREIIFGRQPGEFGFDADDNIEMHFYDGVNRLIGSVVIPVSTGIISSRTIVQPNSVKEEKIVIDMTRVQNELGLLIPPGTYTVALNFFSDEIGSFTNKKLSIQEVSPSRTELRLSFNTTFTQTEENELFEFVQPSIPRVVAEGFMENLVGLTDVVEKTQFINDVVGYLLDINPTLVDDLADLEADAPENLNLTIDFLAGAIYDEFVALLEVTKNTAKFDRLQASELDVLVQEAVNRVLVNTNMNLFTQNTIRYI